MKQKIHFDNKLSTTMKEVIINVGDEVLLYDNNRSKRKGGALLETFKGPFKVTHI